MQIAALLNKNSFCRIHKLTPFGIKTNLRENRFFCGKVDDWWPKRALIMLNFLLKTRQKSDYAYTHLWAIAQRTRASTTASASGCRACCSRPMQTASWKRRSNLPLTASFWLVGIALNHFRPITFWYIAMFWHRRIGAEFQISSYLCPVLSTWAQCLSGFYSTKIINSSQFIEILKSQDDFVV